MPRKYERRSGNRPYKTNYSDQELASAISDVHNGMSIKKAAEKHRVPRRTLADRLSQTHGQKPGRPTVFSNSEEAMLRNCLQSVAEWGYPLSVMDFRLIIKGYLEKKERNEKRFKNNVPGVDFIRSFAARNRISFRRAGNIRRARSAVDHGDIQDYFDRLRAVLENAPPDCIFNYDETNLTDHPGEKLVMVQRGTKRVERVQEHSKMTTSMMVCGNAAGELLPPMIVYKAINLYENWTSGGPRGAVYDVTQKGWFDARTFRRWFKTVFLPFAESKDGVKILIGDNLSSHFDPETVALARENNIYFSSLPPNSTHLTQPLDVAFFRSMKTTWRQILDTWRIESRLKGSIPKEHFPTLLNRLWNEMRTKSTKLLKSAFTATGLSPFSPHEVLKRLPHHSSESDTDNAQNTAILSSAVEDFLKENRGWGDDAKPKMNRGKKIIPGTNITEPPASSSSDVGGCDENLCSQCKADFLGYRGPDWVACVDCYAWFCGNCFEYDPLFQCPQCVLES